MTRTMLKSKLHRVTVTEAGPSLFKVIAVPLASGGVLEYHIELEDVLARDQITGLYSRFFFEIVVRNTLSPKTLWI